MKNTTDPVKVTAWVTKYALTHGIRKVDGDVYPGFNGDVLYFRRGNGTVVADHGEWYLNKEEAIACAKRMRDEEINKLKNKILKLERIVFVE